MDINNYYVLILVMKYHLPFSLFHFSIPDFLSGYQDDIYQREYIYRRLSLKYSSLSLSNLYVGSS